MLKGIPKIKPVVARDQKGRLKSAELVFANNAIRPGKNEAKPTDASKPFFFLSVEAWAGRTQSPPANLHEFEWEGQVYQMWVRVYGSDAKVVAIVRKAIDEHLREPNSAK